MGLCVDICLHVFAGAFHGQMMEAKMGKKKRWRRKTRCLNSLHPGLLKKRLQVYRKPEKEVLYGKKDL